MKALISDNLSEDTSQSCICYHVFEPLLFPIFLPTLSFSFSLPHTLSHPLSHFLTIPPSLITPSLPPCLLSSLPPSLHPLSLPCPATILHLLPVQEECGEWSGGGIATSHRKSLQRQTDLQSHRCHASPSILPSRSVYKLLVVQVRFYMYVLYM